MADGSHTTLGPSNAVSRIGGDDLPRCEECGLEDDNLERGVCLECQEHSAPTAYELYRDERTY